MSNFHRFAVMLATVAAPLSAQPRELSVADSSPFRQLPLPSPNEYRGGDGRPGPRYWQQRADYRIVASLDTATHMLRGRETIHYVNNAPRALPYLWLQVEQNICAPTSIMSTLDQPPLVFGEVSFDFSCGGFTGQPSLDTATIAGAPMKRTRYGTTLRIDLPRPLAPGASVDLDFAWHFTVPEQGVGRMGRDGPLYEIAQWYPRMAVYDDVRGWNQEPYIGAGEFYLEYGDFDVTLTLPASYLVAATGELRNPEAVLTAAQRARLAAARRSDTAVAIVTRAEAGDPRRTRPGNHPYTWHFTATNVRDFAWAGAPNWIWDASGYDGILIQTLYRPTADKWPEAQKMARTTIKHFSEQWYRYPWPHATTVEGPVQGMEYPMLTFVPNLSNRQEQFWDLAHEFGHEWFPMIVGSNERLYPWMDEGFNSFIDLRNAALYFAGTAYGDTIEVNPLHLAATHTTAGQEQPLITNPTEVRDLMWTGYQKPALMLHLLRTEVLGPERFDAAFRDYIATWAFKHPTPADFFRVMRDASGMDLDWFWRDWVYTTARLDQAVDSVTAGGADRRARVWLSSRGTMIMPAELRLTFDDGTTETVRLPVQMWNLGPRFTYRAPAGRTVRRAEVDPRKVYPDMDRANDAWERR
ncbi:peptidase [Gemmatirosa kalamazoonensis]|uniref:Peptidase n=1 Tax=Gemmatirosa kalamazoonensis TaxID=861299 RepID=W0RG19_9BACT|nr:M1 family metallopeptidase [Gemmatirosa kalamazoonensis]AHG89716.1 peptidase [Gemmatirosa kalamazoonensis]